MQPASSSVSGNALARAAAHYASRFEALPADLATPPVDNLALVVTVPAHDEPDLARTLSALATCDPPDGDIAVEVLVLINAAADAPAPLKARNQEAHTHACALAASLAKPWLRIHTWLDNEMPPAHAGVGLARKVLMDTALQRLAQSRWTHTGSHLKCDARPGIIAAFDADCVCDETYLAALVRHFEQAPRLAGASIYFEHDLECAQTREAIVHYELYLRSYRLGLHYAGSPYAHHTVGSSMAVRALDYAKLGGMNRKQAGEDFYFLQKFMQTGRFAPVRDTCVRPSARISTRVPFGTGAAIGKAVNEAQQVPFYDLRIYDDLKCFYDAADQWSADPEALYAQLSPSLRAFLDAQEFAKRLAQIKRNAASTQALAQHVTAWMNGFRCMKYARFASQHHYDHAQEQDVVAGLLTRLADASEQAGNEAQPSVASANRMQRLLTLRQLDRRL